MQLDLLKSGECLDCGVGLFRPRYGSNGRGWGIKGGPLPLRCGSCKDVNAAVRAAAWKRSNPEKMLLITRDRYRRKRDQMRASTERWRRNNPDKVRDIREARRARERGAFVEHVDRVVVWDTCSGRCGICGASVPLDEMELDHIVPLSRGGLHEYTNCQPAHMVCNRQKHNKVPSAS